MKKLTTKEFVEKAKSVHTDKYDYSNSIYKTIKDKLTIICPYHGPFTQLAEKHLRGRGCISCGIIKQKETCLKKYGTENPFSSPICKEILKQTMIKKYGGVGMSSPTLKEKAANTNVKKYGCKNPFSNKNIISKIISNKDYKAINKKVQKTTKEKYGVNCIFSLKSTRNKGVKKLKEEMIQEIFNGSRLKNKVKPLFSPAEYINVITQYKFQCVSCSNDFFDDLDDGKIPRCPKCFPFIVNSKYEYEIVEFLKTFISDEIIQGNRKILNGQELDIYIPAKKLAIEFNGLYYHTELTGGKNKYYHLNKTELCEKQNIHLIHIFEDEWKNNKDLIKSRLKNLLLTNSTKIYARNCSVKEINEIDSSKFLSENHTQGSGNSKIKLGLFFKNNLVSVMTFGKLRIALGNKQRINGIYEMYRFCCLKDTNIIGAASKLLSHFIKTYAPIKIISYADRRWSTGNLYEKLGFKKVSDGTPNYWYVNSDHTKRFYRFNFRKDKLKEKLQTYNIILSEWKNMQNNGWDRIWDCGHLKYEWLSNVN